MIKVQKNYVFINEVHSSIPHSLRHYRAQNLQVKLTDIACQVESLHSIESGAGLAKKIT